MKSEATGLHLSPSLIKKREGSQGAPELSRARGTRGAKAGPAGAPSRTFRMNGGDSAPHPADPSAGVPAAPRTPRPGRAPGGRIGHLEFGPGVRAAAPAAAAAAAAAAACWSPLVSNSLHGYSLYGGGGGGGGRSSSRSGRPPRAASLPAATGRGVVTGNGYQAPRPTP